MANSIIMSLWHPISLSGIHKDLSSKGTDLVAHGVGGEGIEISKKERRKTKKGFLQLTGGILTEYSSCVCTLHCKICLALSCTLSVNTH
jgi:hypothetical protein